VRAAALTVVALALMLAGCGGSPRRAAPPAPPHIPRALAHSLAAQASAVAQSLAAGDGCGAQEHANQLRGDVVLAVSEHRIPVRYRQTLTAAVDDLPDRITCNPAPPAPAFTPPAPRHDHGPGFGFPHGHHHGRGGR
jgi:hypothetical protein